MAAPRNDGLDISNHQRPEEIVWADVPLYPLMAHKATEGKGYRDPYFVDRFRLFRERGHKYRGAYHWIRSDSPMEAQVANLTATLEAVGTDDLLPGEFVQLDWETTPNIPNVTPAQVDEWLRLFRERWGDRVIVYCAAWVPGFTTWRNANPDVPVWYADYRQTAGRVAATSYDATLWQWTSTAQVPGISEGVDANEILRADVLDRIAAVEPTPEPPTPRSPSMLVVCTDSPMWPNLGAVYQLVGNGVQRIYPEFYPVLVASGYAPANTLDLPKVPWSMIAPFA
jgi:GH25 family lysozyme M1 (1,4-beta-N-acetylmuramidase)